MILDYLIQTLGDGTRHNTKKGMQYSFKCPFCNDHKERLFINVDRHVFKCHNCDEAGTMIQFISKHEHLSWKDALTSYREYESYDRVLPESIESEIYEKLFKVESTMEIPKFVYPLPDEFVLVEDATGIEGRQAVKYLESRGVTLQMAERYYIGYCPEGQYSHRIIMPDFEKGEMVYWQARTWLEAPKNTLINKIAPFKKVLNPSLTADQIEMGVNPIDKSEVISNIDFILESGMAVLCEGKFDAYAIGDLGGCLHGKVMSDYQFIKLVVNKDKIDTIAIMLDGDALKNAIVIADRLNQHFDDIRICKLPQKADPSSLGTKGVIQYLKESLPYNTMFAVRAKLKGWNN